LAIFNKRWVRTLPDSNPEKCSLPTLKFLVRNFSLNFLFKFWCSLDTLLSCLLNDGSLICQKRNRFFNNHWENVLFGEKEIRSMLLFPSFQDYVLKFLVFCFINNHNNFWYGFVLKILIYEAYFKNKAHTINNCFICLLS